MHEPNLQNIPKDYVIENDVLSLRSAFVPKSGQFHCFYHRIFIIIIINCW